MSESLAVVLFPESSSLLFRVSKSISKSPQDKYKRVARIYLGYDVQDKSGMTLVASMSLTISAIRDLSKENFYESWSALAYKRTDLRTSMKSVQRSTLAEAELRNLLGLISFSADSAVPYE